MFHLKNTAYIIYLFSIKDVGNCFLLRSLYDSIFDFCIARNQDIMIKSAIGIVFIMLAWTIVTYVASSLGYTKI